MEIDDKKIEKILSNLEIALGKIGRIDSWLPRAMHDALSHRNGIHGIPDPLGLEKVRKDKRDEEKFQAEIDNLHSQIEESQRQTMEMRKQSKYLFYAFIVAFLGLLFNAIIQISPDLFGLITRK